MNIIYIYISMNLIYIYIHIRTIPPSKPSFDSELSSSLFFNRVSYSFNHKQLVHQDDEMNMLGPHLGDGISSAIEENGVEWREG